MSEYHDTRGTQHNKKANKHVKSRDQHVKQMKRVRQQQLAETRYQQEIEAEKAEEVYSPPAMAQAVFVAHDRYINRGRNNRTINPDLPRKWSKKRHEQEQENNDDDEDDEDVEQDNEEQDDNNDDDEDDEMVSQSDDETATHVYTKEELEAIDKAYNKYYGALSSSDDDDDDDNDDGNDDDNQQNDKNTADMGGKSPQSTPLHHHDDDDDILTHNKVVHFVTALNQIELIKADPHAHSHQYNKAKTRSVSKSPKMRPRINSTNSTIDTLPPLDNNNNKDKDAITTSPQHDNDNHNINNTTNNNTIQQTVVKNTRDIRRDRDLIQQMADLKLDGIKLHKTGKGKKQHYNINNNSTTITTPVTSPNGHSSNDNDDDDNDDDYALGSGEVLQRPHPDELDASIWWSYLLSTATVHKDRFIIDILSHFDVAHQLNKDEEYFHLPTHKRSQPDKPLSPYALFKQHTLQKQPELKKIKSTHKKQVKGKATDNITRTLYSELDHDDRLYYYLLALCEKIRYKVQRAEYLFYSKINNANKHH